MRIKSFIASTVQEALASVKREMGDSSIILETRNIEEGDIKSRSDQTLVEVVAAENFIAQNEDENEIHDHDSVLDANLNDDNELQSDSSNLNSELPGKQTLGPDPAEQNLPGENSHTLDQIGSEIENVALADSLQDTDPNDDNELQSDNSNLNSELPGKQTQDPDPAEQNLPGENSHALDKVGDEIENVTLADSLQDTDPNDDNELQSDNSNLNSVLQGKQAPDPVPAEQSLPVENSHALDQIDSEMENVTLADSLQSEDIIEMAGYMAGKSPVTVIDRKSSNLNDSWPEKSKELYKQLRKQQVEKEHSRILINEALCNMSKDDYERIDLQRMMVKKCIIKKVKYHYTNTQNECKTMVFVGSAGSGKTTTISKLATDIKKNLNKDILFISIRGNSVEKLKNTADKIGATVMTVTTQLELREIIDKHGGCSHIFIDTPSISIFDDNTLLILKGYLDEIPNLETHLVISATTRYADIINIAKKITVFPVHRLLFTKIDETNLYGTLFSVAMETQIPLSCITDGYEIPEDISPITAEMVAEMVLGS